MAKLRTLAVYCALICAIIALAAGQEPEAAAGSEDVDNTEATATMQPVSEPPIQLVHVLNPGEREYLSPNLIGLQNIAMTFLPLSMNFINIIDAWREVVNGVRYEILLNAVDTQNNDKEIVCELIVLEKPWLRTQWGDKVRELRQTNCTADGGDSSSGDADDDRFARSKALNDKYIRNSIFNGGTRNELSADDMAKLEAQIMAGNSMAAHVRQHSKEKRMTTTTTEPSETTVAAAVENDSDGEGEGEGSSFTDTAPPQSNDDINDVPVAATSTTAANDITSTTAKELTDDEKNWLDNIFSIGAINFEQQFQRKQQKQQLQQQQAADDERNEQILIEKNEASNYVQRQTAIEPLAYANEPFAQYQQQQQLEQYDGQQQLQEPLAFDNENFQQIQQEQLQQQSQEQQQQQAADINNLQLALSQGTFQRSKRNTNVITGGKTKIDIAEAQNRLQASLDKLSAGEGPNYKIAKIYSATTQIVSGTLTEIDADIINDEEKTERCTIAIWSQPWLSNGNEVTFKCPDKDAVKVRHTRSVEYEEKKSHKKQDHHNLGKVEHLFNKFQVKFERRYHTTMERQMRLRIFQQNLRIIEELNRNEMGSAKYGITEFADMTSSEYKLRTGLWQREEGKPSAGKPAVIPDIELPKEFDWREKGAVTPVKNQGNCGSCWAFSVTGNIEGLNAVKTGQLQEFSEQELLDCDTVDSACNGGLPDNAYKALEDIGGLEYESEYPYKAHKEQCTFNKTMAHVKVTDFVDLPKNETAMAQWLIANGPISIGINANAMQFYRGGVSHPWKMLCSAKNLDHGVLIVGYGVSEYPSFKKTLPYWIIKNSWGPKWGEQGYYRVYRGQNTCGVSEMASSAVLA